MKEIKIKSVASLISFINKIENHFIYRGQANSNWLLQSSLERVLGVNWSSSKAETFEEFTLQKFKSNFHLYDTENLQPNSKLAWLALMQHYGVPTRLIDFTESPYIALYFALEAFNYSDNSDFALYILDYKTLTEESLGYIRQIDKQFKETRQTIQGKQDEIFENTIDRFSYDIAWVTEPKVLNTRIDRQVGSFLLSGNNGARIQDVLSMPKYKSKTKLIRKLVISYDLAEGVFALLRKMNITSKSIYGNLDGLAKSIRMEMQVYAK